MKAGEIEVLIGKKTEEVREAMSGLLAVLIEQSLVSEFEMRTVSIDKEGMEAAGEVESLEETLKELTPIVQARIAVLTRESEEHLAKGDHAGADKKLKEIENAQGQVDSLRKKIGSKEERLVILDGQKKEIARNLFAEIYPSFCKTTHGIIEILLTLLDNLWSGLEEYQRKTDTGPKPGIYGQELLKKFHEENLIPTQGNDPRLSNRLKRWFQ